MARKLWSVAILQFVQSAEVGVGDDSKKYLEYLFKKWYFFVRVTKKKRGGGVGDAYVVKNLWDFLFQYSILFKARENNINYNLFIFFLKKKSKSWRSLETKNLFN